MRETARRESAAPGDGRAVRRARRRHRSRRPGRDRAHRAQARFRASARPWWPQRRRRARSAASGSAGQRWPRPAAGRAVRLRGGRASTGALFVSSALPLSAGCADESVVFSLELLPRSNASLEASGSSRLSGNGLAVAFRPRLAPVVVQWTRPGPFSPLQVVVAPLKPRGMPAASGPCRSCHECARTPGSADGSHRVASSLWAGGPNGVLPGPPGSTSRARNPREAWVASCRTVAGSLRCPCGPGAVRSPRGSCLRSARPRGRRGIGLGPVGVALAGCPRFALARMSPRRRPPSPPVRFVSHGTCRVFTRRSRVRVPRFRRRCAASLV